MCLRDFTDFSIDHNFFFLPNFAHKPIQHPMYVNTLF